MVAISLAAVTSLIAAAATVQGAPAQKRAAPGQADIDTVILNYALTLEHLENAFYRDSLKKLSAEDFSKAGYQPWIRQRFIEIGSHEKAHVQFLTKALGDQAVKECTYNFGVTDVKSFIATSQLLEGVGVSAYLGAAANITSPAYLTAAGSILTTESRHASWVQSSAALSDGFGAPYDVATNFNQTYSLAAPLIVKCPSGNTPLPVKAFPALTLSEKVLKPGQNVKVSGKGVQDGQQVAFLTAGQTLFAPIQGGSVKVPQISTGRTYALVVKSGAKTASDDNTVAGPVASDYLRSAATEAKAAQQSS